MRYSDIKISETDQSVDGDVFVIGDSHAKAMGGANNLAKNGATVAQIGRQIRSIPEGSKVYMTGGHNDVAAGTNPNVIARDIELLVSILVNQKRCDVVYVLFPEGTDNTNQKRMANTRQLISQKMSQYGVPVRDLDGCTLQSDGIHCSLGSYKGIVKKSNKKSTDEVERKRQKALSQPNVFTEKPPTGSGWYPVNFVTSTDIKFKMWMSPSEEKVWIHSDQFEWMQNPELYELYTDFKMNEKGLLTFRSTGKNSKLNTIDKKKFANIYSAYERAQNRGQDPKDEPDNSRDEPLVVKGGLQSGPPYPSKDIPTVAAMQEKLVTLGYSVGSTGIDGKYGPRTAQAVRSFKKDYDIDGSPFEMEDEALVKLDDVESGKTPRVEKPTMVQKISGDIGSIAQDSVTQGKVGAVLDLIAGPESSGRYDAVYPGRRRPQILDMTLTELFKDMRRRGGSSGSSASGRYQYIRTTLKEVTKSMGLDPDTTKFDPETQDKIAIYHLRLNHGLDKWLAGSMDDKAFLKRLANTWAGIPDPSTGKSVYAGVLDNKAGIRVAGALDKLKDIRTG